MNIIENEVKDFVMSTILQGEDSTQLDSEANLIESGILDSMAMMQMVTHLENTYGILIETNDLVPETFMSIRALSEFVAKKLEAGS